MTKNDFLRTIPVSNSPKKIYRGIYYGKGKISASDGEMYVSIKVQSTKTSEGKIYSPMGNLIDVDLRDKIEMDFAVEQYINNKRSYEIGTDELKRVLKATDANGILFDGVYFKRDMLNRLVEAATYLDISSLSLSSVKDKYALVGISLVDHSVLMGANAIIIDKEKCKVKDYKEVLIENDI